MAYLEKSIPLSNAPNMGTTNTSPANRILAASSTVARWARGITIVNNGAAGTWNFALATGAVMTTSNSLWFGAAIAAGATFVHFFPGRGVRLATTDEIMAFASHATMSLQVDYTELDLT